MFAGTVIDSMWPWLISIGDNVTLSSNVTILAHDASTNIAGCGTKLGTVKIGSNVFIGTGSIVLCNVTIGDNVIIGAGSVVTKNCSSNSVYAGNPAKRICSIEDYRERYEKLHRSKPDFSKIRVWYNWKYASKEEKKMMLEKLESDIGFV